MLGEILIPIALKETVKIARNKAARDMLMSLLRHKRKILVLGASGVGKTVFVNTLKDGVARPIPGSLRDVFTRTVKFRKEDIPIHISDTPGQKSAIPEREGALRDAIKRGVSGIVNIVCYGYHEGAASGSKADALDESGKPRKEYLAKRQIVEIEQLYEWVQLIDSDVTKWVMTVVTKADLWALEDNDVTSHYMSGDYYQALGNLPVRVYHSVVPYCSIIEPFYGLWGSGKMGNQAQEQLQSNYMEQLLISLRK